MDQSQKNKNLIKNIAIAFLTVMLLLTFFSNTIMNHSLPEVATASVNSGNVTTKVRGSATVEASQDYNVKLEKQRKIKAVKVKVGDNVKAGQVIVEFAGIEDDDALQAAQDKLDEASLAYAEALCDRVPDYTLEELGISQDQQAVNQAAAGLAKAQQQNAYAKTDAIDTTQQNLNSKQTAYNTAQSSASSAGSDVSSASSLLSNADSAINDANNRLNTAKGNLQNKIDNGTDIKSFYPDIDSASVITQLYIDGFEGTVSGNETMGKKLAAAKTLLPYVNEYNDAKSALATAQSDRTSALSKLSTANAALATANGTRDSAAGELTNAAAALSKVQSRPTDDSGVTSAQNSLISSQNALTTAQITLNEKRKADAVASAKAKLETAAKKKTVDKAQKDVDKILEQDTETECKTENAGVVTAVSCKAGDTVAADNPVASIAVTGNGYTANISVDNSKAKLVTAGQEAAILNVWGGDVKAKLVDIQADTENPNKKKRLKFQITGKDVAVGETLDLSVGEHSGNYDSVVPTSAVREDSKGKFVLVVNSKSTPLGNRYKIKKAYVTVIQSDDTNSAVTGDVYQGQYVVTTATSPLDDGMRVRLKDDAQ